MKSWTIQKLEGLKTGEKFRYYFGDLRRAREHDPEAPKYSAMMAEIDECVGRLEKQGRIQCHTQVKNVHPVRLVEYFAVGL